jgi:hypothetical protein
VNGDVDVRRKKEKQELLIGIFGKNKMCVKANNTIKSINVV